MILILNPSVIKVAVNDPPCSARLLPAPGSRTSDLRPAERNLRNVGLWGERIKTVHAALIETKRTHAIQPGRIRQPDSDQTPVWVISPSPPPRAKLIPSRFIHPHDAILLASGDILVSEWVPIGRITLLRKLDV